MNEYKVQGKNRTSAASCQRADEARKPIVTLPETAIRGMQATTTRSIPMLKSQRRESIL